MTQLLQSYVCGAWQAGTGTPQRLFNPSSEDVMAETSTEGIDFGAVLQFARSRGGPALRATTFAERGEMLRAVSKAIHSRREELIEIAMTNGGNTRGDAKFDLDGGAGTLAYYSSLGSKLGSRAFLLDGGQDSLAKNPRFVGHHVWTPLQGAAVHINAFNFPAWGLCEKAACAWLAGMPVISKPATSTALLAWRLAQIIVEAQILPEGAFQLVCGGTGDLLDRLDHQDVLAFTGSGRTAALIRGKKNIIEKNIRVNVEADSLNAAVLGPDVERESKTYDLFLLEVQREMTQKAGQKCTATRRIFVPEGLVDAVRDDLVEQMRNVRVGCPGPREVTMGPLATAQQLTDVRDGIELLSRVAERIHGDDAGAELPAVEKAKGFFASPTLFYAADARKAAEVHDHEVFGPVQTLMPYDGTAKDASELVNLGGGGLVAGIYSDDKSFIRQMILACASHHGRLHVAGEKIADHSLGSGAVLPQMLHGGPGRAGGGQELGGLRGLELYMQRTAVQGLKPLLEKLLEIEPE